MWPKGKKNKCNINNIKMIKIVKKNWDNITISDYKKILEITEREYDSELEKGIGILSVLCSCSEDDIYGLGINQLKSLLEDIKWIYKPYTFNKNWNAKKIVIAENRYDIVADINKFNVAQYADFQIYWDKRDDIDYMAKLMTVFIIPEGHKYNEGYDIVEFASFLEENISINVFNSVCFFFLKDLILSLRASLYYSIYQTSKMIMKTKDKKKKEELRKMRTKLLMRIKTISS